MQYDSEVLLNDIKLDFIDENKHLESHSLYLGLHFVVHVQRLYDLWIWNMDC